MDGFTPAALLMFATLAFACGYINSAMGMGYGTILTPVLILLGIETTLAVPAVLLSQAFGSITATFFHHRFKHISLLRSSIDTRVALTIGSSGVIAGIIGAWVSININEILAKTYIGTLVLIVGFFITLGKSFSFSWKKILGLGLLSAFNKGLAGGGFGPVVTGGQVLSGRDAKASVGVTNLVHVPVCLSAFAAYLVGGWVKTGGISGANTLGIAGLQWELVLALLIGAVLAAPFGTLTTRRIVHSSFQRALGSLIMFLGIWTLFYTWR